MHIFLSYSTPDYEEANRFRLALETMRPEFNIYFAPKRNELGAYWIERLGTELITADAVILLIGRRIGPWQELEYYDALRLNRNSGHPLIAPVLLTETAPGLPFLDQFHQLSQTLHTFDELVERIINALDGATIEDALPAWRQINPYRGLLAMSTQDAAFFFGREKLTGNILTRIENHPEQIHALIGNSGVGKSSLAMAGILASLRSQLWPGNWEQKWPAALTQSHTWPVVNLKPGESPVKALAQACTSLWLESPADIEQEALKWRRLLLGESSLTALIDATLEQLSLRADGEKPSRLILYVDQAEELYSRAETNEAQHFSTLLADAVTNPNLIVMISLRSDYYGFLQQDTALFKATKTLDIPPLDKSDIERIIRLPAERLQVQFENPDMVPLIAEATAREPGAMPMLSDLLSDAWQSMIDESCSEGVLRFPFTVIDVSHSLADKVERFYAERSAQEDIFKRLFTLKLAHVTKEGEVLRRRLRRSNCTGDEWALIEAMAGHEWRLLTTGVEAGEAVAEVAHEALLRHWPRLSHWLDESREFLIWKGQFEPDQRTWEEASKSSRSRTLLTGLRLDKARSWQYSRGSDLTPTENEFIDDSARAATKNTQQRLWAQRAIFLLMMVSVIAAILALWQRNSAINAEQQAIAHRDKAVKQTSLAVARRLAMASEKVLDENIGETTLAGLLAVKSLQTMSTIEGKRVLRRILALTPDNFKAVKTPWPNSKIQHSPDGKLTAFSRLRYQGSSWKPALGTVAMIDTKLWRTGIKYSQQGSSQPVISANGRWLAIAGYGRRLQIIDLNTTQTIIDAHQDDMIDVAFSPDSHRLYVARTDGIIEVRSSPNWQIIKKLSYPLKKDRPYKVQIQVNSNDSQLLLLARKQNPLLISTENGALIELKGHDKHISGGGIFSPSGSYIVTYGWRGGIVVWDTSSGQAIHKSDKNNDYFIKALTTVPNSERIIFATQEGDIFISDAKTGKTQRQLAQNSWVNALAVSKNGRLLAAVSDDGSAVLWDMQSGKKLLNMPHDDEVWTVKFGTKDQTLITGGKDGSVRVFDIQTGTPLQRFEYDNGITAIAHHPETGAMAVGTNDRNHEQAWSDLIIIDRQTGKKLAQLEHNGGFSQILFSPDSRTLATITGGTRELKIWDTQTGTPRVKLEIDASTLAFSADSKHLIANNSYRKTVIVDTTDGKQVANIGDPGGVELVNMAPDQRTVTTFGQDRSFRNWDVITGKQLWYRQTDRPDDSIEISADGQRYADYSADRKSIDIGEVRTGLAIAVIPDGKGGSLLLSQDGRQLLITRRFLSEPSDPKRRYSEIELWDVDARKRLFRKSYEHNHIISHKLPGGRFAIIARRVNNRGPESVLDVIDAKFSNPLWSTPMGRGFTKVFVPEQRNDFLVVNTQTSKQIRDMATGKLIIAIDGHDLIASEITPDGKSAIFARQHESRRNFEYLIEIWSIKTGLLQKKIPVPAYINDLSISKDGQLLFAAVRNDFSNGVRIWRTADWSEMGFIKMDAEPEILTSLVDPDLLGVLDQSNTFRVWRVSTGTEEHRFSHTLTAQGIHIASATNRVLTWQGASLRLWNTDTGKELAHHLSQGIVWSSTITPDGRTVAYLTNKKRIAKHGGEYKALVFWQPDSNDQPIVLPMTNPTEAQFDPSGQNLIVRHGDQSIQVLDVNTLRTTANIRSLSEAKIKNVTFSADGELLFIREEKNRKWCQRVFSFDPLQEIARVDNSMLANSAPEAQDVITRDNQGQWRSWSPKTADVDKLLWQSPNFPYYRLMPVHKTNHLLIHNEHNGVSGIDLVNLQETVILPKPEKDHYIRDVVLNRKTNHIAIAIRTYRKEPSNHHVIIKDFEGNKELARLQTEVEMGGLEFADQGNVVIMSDTPGYVPQSIESQLWMWRWHTGEVIKLSQDNPIRSIEVNPSGTQFASAEGASIEVDGKTKKLGNTQVRIWDAQTGKELRKLPQERRISDLAYSQDGRFLAVNLTFKVLIYQTSDWSLYKEIDIKQGSEAFAEFQDGGVAFSLDNRIIISGQRQLIRIESLENDDSRKLRHDVKGYPQFKLSPDGRKLATTEDGILRVWDIATGVKLFEDKITSGRIAGFAFAGPSGDDFVANIDGPLIRILWQTDELIAEACRRFTHDITPKEWQRFFDQEPYEKICVNHNG